MIQRAHDYILIQNMLNIRSDRIGKYVQNALSHWPAVFTAWTYVRLRCVHIYTCLPDVFRRFDDNKGNDKRNDLRLPYPYSVCVRVCVLCVFVYVFDLVCVFVWPTARLVVTVVVTGRPTWRRRRCDFVTIRSCPCTFGDSLRPGWCSK